MGTYLIAGAGLSGAVVARELAESTDCTVVVRDERGHVAGNCHTERDAETGILVHRYGPHIFNTDSVEAWEYVSRFAVMRPFFNRVKAVTSKGVFGLPVNLHTINQFFGKQLDPAQARRFVEALGEDIPEPANFEEQGLKMLGRELYETFFAGYTRKQWGCAPSEIPAAVFRRLPVRVDYNDNYYDTRYQGMPEAGYTAMVRAILDHPRIQVELGERVEPEHGEAFDHLFWTGPLDAFFGCRLGRLGYRTVYWTEERAYGDMLGNPVLNYPDMSVPYTRRIEHKHFAPWERHEETIVSTEYSKATGEGDIPYYPVHRREDRELLGRYAELARTVPGVSFVGRLGCYQYLNMDQAILAALEVARDFLAARKVTFPAGVEERLRAG